MAKEKFKCSECKFEAKTSQGRAAHMRLMHNIVNNRDNEEVEKDDTKGYNKNKNHKNCTGSYRPLTSEENSRMGRNGLTIGEMGYILVCDKCGDLR